MANLARQAREQHPGTAVVKRTRNSIHLDIGDGKHVAYIGGSNAYHLPDEQTEIDTAWIAENVGGFQWGMTLADYHARARSVFNAGDLVCYTHPDSGHWVIFDPQSINWINQDNSRQQIAIKQVVTATVGTGIDDDLLRWNNAYGAGRHMTYRAAPGRLEKNIILDAPGSLPAPAAWLTGTIWFEAEFALKHSTGLDLWLDGVKWAKTNGVRVKTANRIEFKDAAGNVLFYMAAPFVADSAGNEAATKYEVRRQGASYFCTVRVPKVWLDTAVFPVYIDPTFDVQPDATAGIDTMMVSAVPNNNYGTFAQIQADAASPRRSLLRFDLTSIDAGSTCDDATLYFTTATTASGTGAFYILSVTDWTEGGATWNKKDGTNNWPGSAGASTAGTDYESDAAPPTIVFPGTSNTQVSRDLTSGANMTAPKIVSFFDTYLNLLFVHITGTARLAPYSSDIATASYRPQLVINYSAGGSAQALDGTSAATSGATGALAVSRPLSASSSITSGATASLDLALPLSASSAATTNATGAMLITVGLSGTSAATTNATGDIGLSLPLSGISAATSGASGSVGLAIPLSGSSTAATGATAALALVVPLSGTSAATSSASAEIVKAVALSGTSAATTSASGNVITAVGLSATSAATSGATGAAVLSIALSASSAATSGATGELLTEGQVSLSGSVLVTSSATGNIILALSLSGQGTATTNVTGAVGLARPLSASSAATTNATATLAALRPLSGTSAATTNATGTAIVGVGLSGASATASGSSGALVLATGLSGTSNVTTSGSGNMALALTLSGQADALTTATAVLVVVAAASIIYTGTVRGVGNLGRVSGPGRTGHVAGVGKTGTVYSSGDIEEI